MDIKRRDFLKAAGLGAAMGLAGGEPVGEYVVSDNIILQADTERTDTSPVGGVIKYKEVTVAKDGFVKVTYEYKHGTFAGGVVQSCYWELRRNSTNIDSHFQSTATTYATRTETNIAVTAGDKLSLWMEAGERDPTEPLTVTAYCRNFRVKADVEIATGGSVDLN